MAKAAVASFSLLGLATTDQVLSPSLQPADLLAESLILGVESGRRRVAGTGVEAVLDLAGVLVDGLPTAAGLLGLPGHGSVRSGKGSGGVEDPRANR